jgi:multiple sugar transport system permease protein
LTNPSWHVFRRRGGKLTAYLTLLALSAFVLLPVAWMLTAALKPDFTPIFTLPPQWIPHHYWAWHNFVRVVNGSIYPFGRYFLNTCIILVGNILGILLSCSVVAYAFARLRFPGRNVLFYVLIVTMLIPWQALVVPQFLIFYHLGWYGTYLPLIVPAFGANAFYVFLIRQYMMTIPRELDEAARVDGLGYWQTYWRIILPLSTPALTVCAVFTFLSVWNDLLGPLIYLNDQSKFTVALGLANMVYQAGNAQYNVLMAANLLAIIPPVVLYFLLQRKLIGGIASVGLKG